MHLNFHDSVSILLPLLSLSILVFILLSALGPEILNLLTVFIPPYLVILHVLPKDLNLLLQASVLFIYLATGVFCLEQ